MTTQRILVVGGSLVGLSVALAASKKGGHVTVFEKSSGHQVLGGGLGINVPLLQRVTGSSSAPPVCAGPDRDTTACHLLRDWLTSQCLGIPGLQVISGAEVADIAADAQGAYVTTIDGRQWAGDVVVGADGVYSLVRRFVEDAPPTARYAGYILWRALVREEDLAGTTELPGLHEPSREHFSEHYRLVTYLVPGQTGDTRVGHRRLNLVWYDPAREFLLRSHGLLDSDSVLGSLGASELPSEVSQELIIKAEHAWPPPWNSALRFALDHHLVYGTPVAEYLPKRLVSGRIALAGDAAHAATPMVGGGFRMGLLDAAQLANSLLSTPDIQSNLRGYERSRLGPAIEHVRRSLRSSRTYLRGSLV